MKSKKKVAVKKKPKVKKIPTFNSKEYVKLSDLARELKIDYRSCFLKQQRLGILAQKCLEKDREVVCFTQANADKIRASTAPFITPSYVELSTIEKECKIVRAKMLQVLSKIAITPEKRRRFEENPRSVLTVKAILVKRIKEAVKNLC